MINGTYYVGSPAGAPPELSELNERVIQGLCVGSMSLPEPLEPGVGVSSASVF